MKIAYIVDHFPRVSETFIFAQIAGMLERGHEVTIFANRLICSAVRHPIVEKYDLIGRTIVVPQPEMSIPARIVQAIPMIVEAIGKGHLKAILNSLNFFRYGRKAISLKLLIRTTPRFGNTDFDVIHCQFGQLAVEVPTLRKSGVLRGVLVTSFRGWDTTVYVRQFPGAYGELFKSGDAFLPVCKFLKSLIVNLGCPEDKTRVLYSGIDIEKLPFRGVREIGGQVKILTVGRLTEKKGVVDGLRAVHALQKEGWKIQYQIAGAGPLRRSLQKMAVDLDIEASVEFLGAIDSVQVIELLQLADVFIAPSTTGVQGDAEGIPNSIKEAMAIGVPIVSTKHGGIPELLRDKIDGYLVDEKSPEKIATAVKRIRDDPAMRAKMILSARKTVQERFDIRSLNNDLEYIYSQVAAAP